MTYGMKPLGCDPARIKGMSERRIVSSQFAGATRIVSSRGSTAGLGVEKGNGFDAHNEGE
jgi:Fe-Mn family superoxide dismutase